MKVYGNSDMIAHIDLEKAYDFVDGGMLDFVLGKMGFGNKWRKWVKSFVSTASYSILINGSPHGFFNSSRGIRQGDPLSPYLFVIVVEALSRLLLLAECKGFLRGLPASNNSKPITQLQFADDTLIFLEEGILYMDNLRRVIH
ncbi:secreted RxLR effector protein 78-like [Tasmannia lanceolata]|uniref:secreted RxLR effector protein 78-like n=1 Tax=Tasmannia lanceolata TaxID=3420 RepID=UPI004062D5DD